MTWLNSGILEDNVQPMESTQRLSDVTTEAEIQTKTKYSIDYENQVNFILVMSNMRIKHRE